jgi:hypothetical protein
MGNVTRKMEILRKKQKDMPEMKDTERQMKSTFDGLIGRLAMAGETISDLEGVSIGTCKTKRQREKLKNPQQTEYSRSIGQLQKVYMHITGLAGT